jgi:carboxypeptidase T
MKVCTSFFLCVVVMFTGFSIFAQENADTYSRVKVYLGEKQIRDLAALGVDVTHGKYEKDCCFTSDFSSLELNRIRSNGFVTEVQIPDVVLHYQEQNKQPLERSASSRRSDCVEGKPSNIVTPANFSLGSMGGFHRFSEIMDHLDLMHIRYPHLITQRQRIGNFATYRGRSLHYVRISNNPDVDQPGKPKILHTALHHAREPISASQLIYFMWYLLENYDKDPYVKSLVDASEIYFVPVLNVDGYLFNEENNPSGGGMFRKNRRVMGTGNIGVDLNRNYNFMWGFDNVGSSPNGWDETYRGPSPASEPEIRAIQFLCSQFPFDIALNHHSHGNALLFPFGYADVAVPDHQSFFFLSKEMTAKNNYDFGRPWEVPSIGYATNGSSDDWMYGEKISKPAIYAFTPEIGNQSQGFWPHRDDIIPLCQQQLHMNLASVALASNHGNLTEMSPDKIGVGDSRLIFKLLRNGLRGGQFEVRVKPLSTNVSVLQPNKQVQLFPNTSTEFEVNYVLNPGIMIGDMVHFAVELDLGHVVLHDTVSKVFYGEKMERFTDRAVSMDNWFVEGFASWGIDDGTAFLPPSSISDSPGKTYTPSTTSVMRLFQPINLSNARAAYLSFRARWYIEPGADFVQISASRNGFVFTPLCGRFTKASSNPGKLGEPIYDGFQDEWILEIIDLEDFLGDNLFLQISLTADHKLEFDGFFLDDIRVVTFENSSSTASSGAVLNFKTSAFPNPGSDRVFIDLSQVPTEYQQGMEIRILNLLGEQLYSGAPQADHRAIMELQTNQLNAGMYIYQILHSGRVISNGKINISR